MVKKLLLTILLSILPCLAFATDVPVSFYSRSVNQSGPAGFSDDANTLLLVHCDSSFVDSSSHAHSVTIGGDATTTNDNLKVGTGALKSVADGGLLTPDSSDWYFNTSDFTLELWFKVTSTIADRDVIFFQQGGNYPDSAWRLKYHSGTAPVVSYIQLVSYGSSLKSNNWNFTPTTNQWYHIALVRYGNTATLYINGVSQGGISLTGWYFDDAIGSLSFASVVGGGYYDEVRISNIARYLTDFTVDPNEYGQVDLPLNFYSRQTGGPAPDEYTKIMLHFNGTEGSNTFTDETGKSWQSFGGVPSSTSYITQTNKVFGNGAGLFTSGSGHGIFSTNNSDVSMASQDFTVEFWVYLNGTRPISSTQRRIIIGSKTYTAAGDYEIELYLTNDNSAFGGKLYWIFISYDSVTRAFLRSYLNRATNPEPNFGGWNWLVFTRQGTSAAIYQNGTRIAYASTPSTDFTDINGFLWDASNNIYIGMTYDGINPGYELNGLIDDFRWSVGIARYGLPESLPLQSIEFPSFVINDIPINFYSRTQ